MEHRELSNSMTALFPFLTCLHLNGRVDEGADVYIPALPAPLRSLTLAGFNITGSLNQLSQLTELHTFSTSAVTPRGMEKHTRPGHQLIDLFAALPVSLTDLNVSDASYLPEKAAHLLVRLTALQKLRLCSMGGCTSGVAALACHISSLAELTSFTADWGGPRNNRMWGLPSPPHAWEAMLHSLQNLPKLCADDARPAQLVAKMTSPRDGPMYTKEMCDALKACIRGEAPHPDPDIPTIGDFPEIAWDAL